MINKYVINAFKDELQKIANANPMSMSIYNNKAPTNVLNSPIMKDNGLYNSRTPMTPPMPTVYKMAPLPPGIGPGNSVKFNTGVDSMPNPAMSVPSAPNL